MTKCTYCHFIMWIISLFVLYQFYKLDMFYDTPTGEIALAPPTFILNQLKWIVEDAKERNPYPVGVLTTEHRDKWYEAREKLRKGKIMELFKEVISIFYRSYKL